MTTTTVPEQEASAPIPLLMRDPLGMKRAHVDLIKVAASGGCTLVVNTSAEAITSVCSIAAALVKDPETMLAALEELGRQYNDALNSLTEDGGGTTFDTAFGAVDDLAESILAEHVGDVSRSLVRLDAMSTRALAFELLQVVITDTELGRL